MYKFVTIQGSCGTPYDITKCEETANKMASSGYELDQVYQSSTASCCAGQKSILVMVFKKVQA